ncbi:MAG: Ldh family oxidoreductase [Chloroflexi bacterium]|nr:Ldh family oxidoreductase [Chloroflexota bacterium]
MPTFHAAQLQRLTAAVFRAAGAPDDIAEAVADVLVDNHLAGHDSHGILRIPEYLQHIREGSIVPAARPRVLQESPTTALVSGSWAFGQVTAAFAADLAIEKALRQHVSVVSVVEAGHTGRLAAFTERAARRNVAMFMFIGTVERPLTAPFGGAGPVLGTNPVSFSVPNPAGDPVTLDYATSAIAAGKVRVAKARGEQLPEGVMLTRDGQPTTDPEEWYRGGVLLPFGGHKGYALAVIAELLSGPLAAADAYPGVVGRSGIFLFAVDAATFRPLAAYGEAVSRTVGRIKAVPPAPGFDEVLVPGEPEARARAQRTRDGIPVPEATWSAVSEAARSLGVDVAAVIGSGADA